MLCLEVQVGGPLPFSKGGHFHFCSSTIFFSVIAFGRRQAYEDLDAMEGIKQMLQILDATIADFATAPSSNSSGSKGQRAKAKGPTNPPHDYLVFVERIAMDYIQVQSLEML